MRLPLLVAGALTVLSLAAGCGDDDTSGTAQDEPSASGSSTATSPAASPTPPPGLPACAKVWVADKTLERGYRGCLEGSTWVRPDSQYCEFGKRLYRYDDHFWAVANGPIQETRRPLAQDKQYKGAMASCMG
jgi:hypothetical protein